MTDSTSNNMAAAVCVVIPSFGPTPHLAEILDAIARGTRAPESIVVSHSGLPGIDADLRRAFPDVTFLENTGRLFAGAARNRGAAVGGRDILAFCDSDVVPAPDWLSRLVGALEASPQRFVVGAVGMARTGGYWGTTNWVCEFSEQAPWRKEGEQTGGASCNMAVYRSHFEDAGGFPEMFRTGQDTLFFHALRTRDLQQWFVPTAVVGHFNQSGIASMAAHQQLHGRGFVKLRREARLPGWRLVRRPWLAPILPLAKACRVVRRLMEGGPAQWMMILTYMPGLVLAMACWGAGMAKELLQAPVRAAGQVERR